MAQPRHGDAAPAAARQPRRHPQHLLLPPQVLPLQVQLGTLREHQTCSLLQGGAADRLLPAPAGPAEVRRGPLPRLRAPPPPRAAARAAARRGLQLAPGGQVAPGLLPARAPPQPPRVRLLLRAVVARGGLLHQAHPGHRRGRLEGHQT